MDELFGSRSLVQVIDILGGKKKLATPSAFQLRERYMGGIRFDFRQLRAPRVVKFVHQPRVECERFRSCHVLNAVPFPQAIFTAKRRQAALAEMPAPVRTNILAGPQSRSCVITPLARLARK
jgi:hypothetical protein